jgi:hypothetical protein
MVSYVDEMEKLFDKATDNLLPFECWEKLTQESASAFAAFCVFRDFGSERNIKRAVAASESDKAKQLKKYRIWRNWSTQYHWFKRASDYDVYLDKGKAFSVRARTLRARAPAMHLTARSTVLKSHFVGNQSEQKSARLEGWRQRVHVLRVRRPRKPSPCRGKHHNRLRV